MRPRHGAYNMRPVHEVKQLASSGRAGPAQRVFGSPCPRPDSEARAPAKNHHLRRGHRRLRCRSKRGEEGRWSRRGRGPGPLRVRRAHTGTRRGGARRCEASPAVRRRTLGAGERRPVRRRTLGAGERRDKVRPVRAGGSRRVASGVGAAIRRRIDPRSGHRSAMPRQP